MNTFLNFNLHSIFYLNFKIWKLLEDRKLKILYYILVIYNLSSIKYLKEIRSIEQKFNKKTLDFLRFFNLR